MAESVYKIIEVVGTSPESWEKAATAAVNRAATKASDFANERQEFGRFRPFDDKAVQEASQ